MNERIRELAEQATTIEYGVDNGFDRVTFDKEKFAELIIEECLRVMTDEFWGTVTKYIKQLRCFDSLSDVPDAAADRIEKLEAHCVVYAKTDRMRTDHVNDLEAKLAKAVEALRWYDDRFTARKARDVLAELEGQ